VGGLVGPAVGGLLADVSGLRAPFTLTGVAAAAAAVYGLLRLPETRALGAAARSREADARGAEEAGGSGAVRASAAPRPAPASCCARVGRCVCARAARALAAGSPGLEQPAGERAGQAGARCARHPTQQVRRRAGVMRASPRTGGRRRGGAGAVAGVVECGAPGAGRAWGAGAGRGGGGRRARRGGAREPAEETVRGAPVAARPAPLVAGARSRNARPWRPQTRSARCQGRPLPGVPALRAVRTGTVAVGASAHHGRLRAQSRRRACGTGARGQQRAIQILGTMSW